MMKSIVNSKTDKTKNFDVDRDQPRTHGWGMQPSTIGQATNRETTTSWNVGKPKSRGGWDRVDSSKVYRAKDYVKKSWGMSNDRSKNWSSEEIKNPENDSKVSFFSDDDDKQAKERGLDWERSMSNLRIDVGVKSDEDNHSCNGSESEDDSIDFSSLPYDSDFGRFVRNDLQQRFNLPNPPVRPGTAYSGKNKTVNLKKSVDKK